MGASHHTIVIPHHHIIIASYHHSIISAYHYTIISSYQQTTEWQSASQFRPKSQEKNRLYHFYPSTKSHRQMNFGTSGVTFRDERHCNAQKFIAPQNRTIFDMTLIFCSENFIQKKKLRRKFKCRESSETRFAKVSGRTEPCLRVKRLFEVLDFFFEICEICRVSKN